MPAYSKIRLQMWRNILITVEKEEILKRRKVAFEGELAGFYSRKVSQKNSLYSLRDRCIKFMLILYNYGH